VWYCSNGITDCNKVYDSLFLPTDKLTVELGLSGSTRRKNGWQPRIICPSSSKSSTLLFYKRTGWYVTSQKRKCVCFRDVTTQVGCRQTFHANISVAWLHRTIVRHVFPLYRWPSRATCAPDGHL